MFFGNFIGAVAIAMLMLFTDLYAPGNGSIGAKALIIAEAKCNLGFTQAIILGILCNTLVCFAVWLCYSVKTTSGKIMAIIFPITAFVAAGVEHSIANMYFIPKGLIIKSSAEQSFWKGINSSPKMYENLNWSNFSTNNLLSYDDREYNWRSSNGRTCVLVCLFKRQASSRINLHCDNFYKSINDKNCYKDKRFDSMNFFL